MRNKPTTKRVLTERFRARFGQVLEASAHPVFPPDTPAETRPAAVVDAAFHDLPPPGPAPFPPGPEPPGLDPLAEIFATLAIESVERLVARPLQAAVLDRIELVEGWALRHHGPSLPPDLRTLAAVLGELEHQTRPRPVTWPLNVSPHDIFKAFEDTKEPGVRAMIEAWRASLVAGSAPLEAEGAAAPPEVALDPVGLARARWPLGMCAHILSVAKHVQEDAALPRFPIPATKEGRVAMAGVAHGPGPKDTPLLTTRLEPVKSRKLEPVAPRSNFMLFWRGKADAVQLGFDFGDDLDEALLRGILAELQEDGLRDYLILHRMAADQGRTGQIRWSWAEHRQKTSYAAQVANSDQRDAELAAGVVARIRRLKGAELFKVRRIDDRKDAPPLIVRERIGPFGLIDIAADASRGSSLELAIITLNPAIYTAAARDSENPYFALLPHEALTLEGRPLHLAVMLALAFRVARDDSGVIVRSARSLWEYLLADGGRPADQMKRYRWARLDASTQKALDRLQQAGVIGGWTREPGEPEPTRRYAVRPPAAWRDHVIHGVNPAPLPARANVPHTTGELRAWRKERKLSQPTAAKVLGVGINTIERAEAKGATAPLGPALRKAFERLGANPPLEPRAPSGESPGAGGGQGPAQ